MNFDQGEDTLIAIENVVKVFKRKVSKIIFFLISKKNSSNLIFGTDIS